MSNIPVARRLIRDALDCMNYDEDAARELLYQAIEISFRAKPNKKMARNKPKRITAEIVIETKRLSDLRTDADEAVYDSHQITNLMGLKSVGRVSEILSGKYNHLLKRKQ